MKTISRRTFVHSLSAATGSLMAAPLVVGAVEPFQRTGPPRLLLSLAAYSFRQYFIDGGEGGKPVDAAKSMDLFKFIDFCAQNQCVGAELTSYYFPKDISSKFLLDVRRHAFMRGVEISGTAVGNTFTHPAGEKRTAEIESVKTWIDRAAIMGAPHIRVFAGSAGKLSLLEAKKLCIAALEETAAYAGTKGIMLGIENHGGIVAEASDLLEIVRAVRSPWVGVNLDSGNFNSEDPYADLAKCAPYAVNVQIKGEIKPRGKAAEPADLKRIVSLLKEAGYQGYAALEYESREDPWQAVPRLLKQLQGLLG